MKWLLSTIGIMLGLPLFTVSFVSHDAGMLICFLLFFIIDPGYSILVGIFSGRNIKKQWFQPFFTSFAFLMGTWLFFDERETAFFGYAAAYLGLGLTAMLLFFLLSTFKNRR